MRHNKKFNHLGRTSAHRKAMLSNMANSLIFHKRITTTVAKAKALRIYVEPLVTKAKDDSTHSRRVVFEYLKSKTAVSMLFRDVAAKVGDRPGGYTRILKTGNRIGDNADMCIIELVDFNENMLAAKEAKAKPAKSRRGGKKKADAPKAVAEPKTTVAPAKEVKPVVEEVAEDVVETAPEDAVIDAPEAATEE
jgi:large subunit ribosomal protein L17